MRKTSLALAAAALLLTAPAAIAQSDTGDRLEQQEDQTSTTESVSSSDRQERLMTGEARREARQEMRQEMRSRSGRAESRRSGMPHHRGAMRQAMPNQWHAMLMSNPRMRGLVLQTVFALMDADGDGAVSLEEAQEFMTDATMRVFNGVDADNDGEVTLEELRAFVQGR